MNALFLFNDLNKQSQEFSQEIKFNFMRAFYKFVL